MHELPRRGLGGDADVGRHEREVDVVNAAATTEGPPREALQELPRPEVMDVGRVRLLDYPAYERDSSQVERMQLEMRSYCGAAALPLTKIEGTKRVTGAIYTRRGRLVRDSERAKGQRGSWHSNKNLRGEVLAPHADRLPGRSFFLGYWSPGFGHVLLEMLPRLWPAQDYARYDHFVLYPWRMDATPLMEPTTWLRDLLGYCGIPLERVVMVREPVRFETIDITTPPFILKRGADPRFLDVFGAITKRVLASGTAPLARDLPKRIYLSRSLVPGRTAANEEELESVMERRGFTVLHPQNMSIAEQVATLAQVEVIAGGDGSALHMAAFARPGTKLLALDSRVVPSQFVIDLTSGLDALHLLAGDRAIHRRAKWVADIPRVEAALDLLLSS